MDGVTGRQVISTPCKINLYLGIYPERDARGYHRVDSVMVPVALFDTIEVSDAASLEVHHDPALEVPPDKSTVWRAATLLFKELGIEPNVRIDVTACIPERAGLGGSSADAGATLRALAQRLNIQAHDERVVSVARRVGADVAFFLNPIPGLYVGAGDVLGRALPGIEVPLALVMPPAGGVSTREAYDEFDRTGVVRTNCDALCAALEAGDISAVAANLSNNLAPAAFRLSGDVWSVWAWLRRQPGVLAAQVTGSGSCSFALCESAHSARRIALAAQRRHGWRAWATHTLVSG